MTQLNFNLNMDTLKDSLMKSNLDDVMKSAMVLVLNEFMEKERDDYLQVQSHERSIERTDYRNGYYERDLMISIGKIRLRVPRTRFGDFSPSIFEKYARCDQAMVLSMLEMFVNGVSTRKVSAIVQTLCGEDVSKSFVSSLTSKLDPLVNEWVNRPLNTFVFEYLFVDAMYIKVREYNKVVSKAVYIATALDDQGYRYVIGLHIDHVESFESWSKFFQLLKSRGLSSPKLTISDAHKGLVKAIEREFIGTSWQRCNVHFKRNIVTTFPKKDSTEARKLLKRIFDADTPEEARTLKQELFDSFSEDPKYQKGLKILDEGFEDSLQFMNFPSKVRVHIRSTNSLERLNQEVRRRERVIRIFPNHQSAFRLIGAVLMEYDKQLRTKNKRYSL
ncbi:IS256 family transposase [Sporosarcina sp.]|uniref:IS256 family transposase n=1 Tax=Sporosarcina sp. TaxID=49982 RepID=UPI00261C02AA|nr:IS256 family transposase [Sporosarcina sp.]